MGRVMLTLAVVLLALAALYTIRQRRESRQWSAPAAWLLMGFYSALGVLLAELTDVGATLAVVPLIKTGQWQDGAWIASTLFVTLLVVATYGWYCRTSIESHSRPAAWLSSGVFGLLWGAANGLIVLSLWHLSLSLGLGWPWWLVWAMAYGLILLWQLAWTRFYFEAWVLPEFCTAVLHAWMWPAVQISNQTVCLVHFTIYQNYWLVIGWHALATVLLALAIRVAPPSNGGRDLA